MTRIGAAWQRLGRPWRWTALAGVLILVLAIVVAGRSRHPAAPQLRVLDQRIDVPGGPGVGGTVSLDTTVYEPLTGPSPAVIMAHGFGGSKDSVAADARTLAAHGFVVLTYSARGFGASTGRIGLDSLDYEVPDARALVDWLSHRSEVRQDGPGDPRVGVTGASYGGALALLLAGTDRRIDAVVPVITWNDLGQALFPNAAGTPASAGTPAARTAGSDGVFKKAWAAALVASISSGRALGGTASSASGAASAAGTDTADADPPDQSGAASSVSPAPSAGTISPATDLSSLGCGRLMPAVCAAYSAAAQSGRINPALSALLARSSPAGVDGDITAPTLLIQGERDTLFGLDQADANARAIAARGTTVAVSWYAGGHDGPTQPDAATTARMTEWFTYYLGRTGAAPAAVFDYSVDGPLADNGRIRSRTVQASVYPGLGAAAPTARTAVALTGGPQIAVNPAGGAPAGISSLPGVSGLAGSALAAFAGGLPGQTAQFTAAPATQLAVVTGSARVTVSVARLAGTTTTDDGGGVLFASIGKVAASGTRTLGGNAVTPIRLPSLPTDGTPVTLTVDLPAVALQVEVGSRLQVTFATTDQAYAGPTAPAVYRVALAGDGAVSVPEIGGVKVSAGDIPVGALIALLVLAAVGLLWLVLGGRVRRRAADARDDSGPVVPPLRITGLGKSYPGGVAAVVDVGFEVQAGQVLGLLGPNGAGKTTTLRMVMGLITPTAGEIDVFGVPVRPGAPILSRIGSFVEGAGFLPHLSGRSNLQLYWRATGRPAGDARFDTALSIAGLGTAERRKVRTYSQGMRQRLAIAQAMLGLPELLLLDEPTNGLDPPQIHAMREVLRAYAATGRTVVISSHLLSEVEQTCTHAVVIHRGRTIAAGTVADLVATSGETVFVVDDVPAAVSVLSQLPAVTQARPGAAAGSVEADLADGSAAVAVAHLIAAGVAVSGVAPRHRLEDVFLQLVGAGPSPEEGT